MNWLTVLIVWALAKLAAAPALQGKCQQSCHDGEGEATIKS